MPYTNRRKPCFKVRYISPRHSFYEAFLIRFYIIPRKFRRYVLTSFCILVTVVFGLLFHFEGLKGPKVVFFRNSRVIDPLEQSISLNPS